MRRFRACLDSYLANSKTEVTGYSDLLKTKAISGDL